MTKIERSALVPYSAEEMFKLVADIGRYPEFLPWCSAARILEARPEIVVAELGIAYAGMDKHFTTENLMRGPEHIEMRLREGPFRKLEGHWRFVPLGATESKVSLAMEFEFANFLASLALGPVFTNIANTLVDSFLRRAQAVYGIRA